MKISNVVIGAKVQVKRDCLGLSGEELNKGTIATVGTIDTSDSTLTIAADCIDGGYAWVDVKNVHKYTGQTALERAIAAGFVKGAEIRVRTDQQGEWGELLVSGELYTLFEEPTQRANGAVLLEVESVTGKQCRWRTQPKYFEVVKQEHTPSPYKVGDEVLVGADGAGYGFIKSEYASKVCTVEAITSDAASVYISHPDVHSGSSYRSHIKHLTKHVPTTKGLTLDDVKIGDYVVYNADSDDGLVKGVAYPVVAFSSYGSLVITNLTSTNPKWQGAYYIQPSYFNKVLRG